MGLLARTTIAHESGQAIEWVDFARDRLVDDRLGGAQPAGDGTDGPHRGGFVQSSAEPAQPSCPTTNLCDSGDRRDDDEHGQDDENEFD
jgi:hypothetical protein